MRYFVGFVVIAMVVAAVLIVRMPVRDDRAARRARRNRAQARWEVDDTGTDDAGRFVVAIELVTPGVIEPYGRRLVGAYDPADNLRWAELRGQAEGMVKELNDRIEEGRSR